MHPTPDWLKKLIKFPDIDDNIKFFGGHKQTVAKNWEVQWEKHLAFEIIYIIDGEQYTEFETFTTTFKKDSIILIPPGTLHKNSCKNARGLSYFCIHFNIDYPESQQKIMLNCPLELDKNNAAYSKIEEIIQHYVHLLNQKKFDTKGRLLVEKLMIDLIIALIEYADTVEENMQQSDIAYITQAKLIADTIKNNFRIYTETCQVNNLSLLSLTTIAKKLNISDSTMLKAFKKVYHITPKQYLDQLRCNEAKYLLNQQQLSINEIAERIGYQSASHFSRQFKYWTNYAPNMYRKMVKHRP